MSKSLLLAREAEEKIQAARIKLRDARKDMERAEGEINLAMAQISAFLSLADLP